MTPESLSLTLTAPHSRVEARVQSRLLDNRWHDVHLLYEQGSLQLVVDKQSVVVGELLSVITANYRSFAHLPFDYSQRHVQHTVPARPGH